MRSGDLIEVEWLDASESTGRLKDEIHAELTKIVGELIVRNGKRKTYDEATMELIAFWREHH